MATLAWQPRFQTQGNIIISRHLSPSASYQTPWTVFVWAWEFDAFVLCVGAHLTIPLISLPCRPPSTSNLWKKLWLLICTFSKKIIWNQEYCVKINKNCWPIDFVSSGPDVVFQQWVLRTGCHPSVSKASGTTSAPIFFPSASSCVSWSPESRQTLTSCPGLKTLAWTTWRLESCVVLVPQTSLN